MRVLSTKVEIHKHTHIQHLLLSLVDTRKYTHQDVVVYREKYQEIRERFFFVILKTKKYIYMRNTPLYITDERRTQTVRQRQRNSGSEQLKKIALGEANQAKKKQNKMKTTKLNRLKRTRPNSKPKQTNIYIYFICEWMQEIHPK